MEVWSFVVVSWMEKDDCFVFFTYVLIRYLFSSYTHVFTHFLRLLFLSFYFHSLLLFYFLHFISLYHFHFFFQHVLFLGLDFCHLLLVFCASKKIVTFYVWTNLLVLCIVISWVVFLCVLFTFLYLFFQLVVLFSLASISHSWSSTVYVCLWGTENDAPFLVMGIICCLFGCSAS